MTDTKVLAAANRYTQMQQKQYDAEAKTWSIENPDPVVGYFHQHNAWKDYEDYLFKNTGELTTALDFACGPGRNIVRFADKFQQIDGVDISQVNLDNAKKYFAHAGLTKFTPKLWKSDGVGIRVVPSSSYPLIFSTIAMQHICVHEIRFQLWTDMFRVLKPGGMISFQMGFGPNHIRSVGYFENNYNAMYTNSGCDTRVENPGDLKFDLEKVGFVDFKHYIRPVGPGDLHDQWIFFSAKKPG
jgi:ubiquinone/menaquinone biosynthesis C-methylase UbiE